MSSLRARVMGRQPPLDAAGVSNIDKQAAAKLFSMFIECMLLLRYGTKGAEVDNANEK